jgi:hypothetical protein
VVAAAEPGLAQELVRAQLLQQEAEPPLPATVPAPGSKPMAAALPERPCWAT